MQPARASFDQIAGLTAEVSSNLKQEQRHRGRIREASPMPHLSTAAMKSTPALPRPRTRGLPLVDPSLPIPSPVWLDIATGTESRTPQLA